MSILTYTKNAPTTTTETKTVNETIHYQGAGNQTPADHTASVNFTRSVSNHTLTFSLPNKIILLFKVPLCNDFFRSFHLLFGVIFIANMN
ncbi:hypothetical protein ABMB44_15590 [Levilactobacillus brevis]